MKTNPDQDRLVEDGGNPNCGIDRPTHPRPTLFTIVMLMIKTTLAGDLFDHFQMYLFNNCWIFIPRTPIITIGAIFRRSSLCGRGEPWWMTKGAWARSPRVKLGASISFNVVSVSIFTSFIVSCSKWDIYTLQPLVLSWGGSFLGLNLFEPRPSYNTLCKFIQRLNAWGKVNMKDVYLRIFRINSSEICEGCTYRRARVKCFFSKI